MSRLIATLFGVGRLPLAPGTWAAALAVAAGVGLHRLGHFPLLLAATLVAVALGFWSVARFTRGMAEKDRPEIVIDEVAGQWIALCAPSAGFWFAGLSTSQFPYPGWVAAFLFFRLFDIWKPWIIRRADRRADVLGVMADDLLAGAFAAVAVILAAGISHGIMGR